MAKMNMKWIAVFFVVSFLAVCIYSGVKNLFGKREYYSTKESDDLGATLSSSGKTAAYFYSPLCSWCTKMNSVYDNVKPAYKDVKFIKIDVSQNKDLANQYKLDGFPHILFFKGSDVVGSSSGYVEEAILKTRLDESLGSKASGLPISQNPTQKY